MTADSPGSVLQFGVATRTHCSRACDHRRCRRGHFEAHCAADCRAGQHEAVLPSTVPAATVLEGSTRRDFPMDFVPDLAATLGPLGVGRGDPVQRLTPDGWWRASRTPEGPGTIHLRVVSLRRGGGYPAPARPDLPTGTRAVLEARAWGPGGGWLLERAPGMAGALDDVSSFDPSPHPVVMAAARLRPSLRMTRTPRVLERLVPTIFGQKVTGLEAKRSWVGLVRLAGEPAPGPAGSAGMLLPPDPAWLAALADHEFHLLGVERRRARVVRTVAADADRLQNALQESPAALAARLSAIPGIGPWTVAEVVSVVAGDADAVSVGDFHLPNLVAWNLAGEPRGTDERMLELLAPWPGHRGRVVRLLEATGVAAPRYGPRLRPRSIRWH